MKRIFSLLIFMSFLMAFGCSSDKSAGSDIDEAILGEWIGYAELIYPGPDDGPVYDTAVINEMTFYEDGSYVIIGSEMPPDPPMPIPLVDLSGTYIVSGDSIEFIPEITDRPPREPYSIEGKYAFSLNGSELTLTQILHPELWPETHTVVLQDSDNGFIIFRH